MPEWGAGLDLDDLDSADRAALIEIIRVYRQRWVIVGPCLDNGWYAYPRHDQTIQRVLAANLPELNARLRERESAP
jgi:hypothetical protein